MVDFTEIPTKYSRCSLVEEVEWGAGPAEEEEEAVASNSISNEHIVNMYRCQIKSSTYLFK